MAVIKIKTPDVSENIRTFLTQEYTSGSSLSVDMTTGFSSGNYIVVGEPGQESTEVTYLSSAPTDTTMSIIALVHSHPRGTPVYFTRWDKYSLEYRTTSAGSWTAYASMPSLIKWDALYAEYRDVTATTTYGWRYRYYSTEQTAYSDYSDTILASGWADNAVGYMVRNVRKIIGDPDGKTVSDAEIIRFFNAAQDKIYTLYDRWWFLLKTGTVIDTVASTSQYSLPSDFGRMDSVIYRYVSGNTDINCQLKYISIPEFDYTSRDNNADADDGVAYYTIMPGDSTNATGYLKIWPKPETAGLDITPRYYKMFTDLDSYGDTTETPIPAILEDYALAQIYKIRKEEGKADYYDKLFREQIDLLKLMQRKQVGPPRSLWKYQGIKGGDRFYGGDLGYSDATRENKW